MCTLYNTSSASKEKEKKSLMATTVQLMEISALCELGQN